MEMNVTLSPEEVKTIIKEHLAKQFKTVGEVKLEASLEAQGYYSSESNVPVFKGATCKVNM